MIAGPFFVHAVDEITAPAIDACEVVPAVPADTDAREFAGIANLARPLPLPRRRYGRLRRLPLSPVLVSGRAAVYPARQFPNLHAAC